MAISYTTPLQQMVQEDFTNLLISNHLLDFKDIAEENKALSAQFFHSRREVLYRVKAVSCVLLNDQNAYSCSISFLGVAHEESRVEDTLRTLRDILSFFLGCSCQLWAFRRYSDFEMTVRPRLVGKRPYGSLLTSSIMLRADILNKHEVVTANCPDCGDVVYNNDLYCPNCGSVIN